MDKIFFSTNIFTYDYQVKDVHLLNESQILYEANHKNKSYLVHQVKICPKQRHFSTETIKLLQNYCKNSFIQKIFIDTTVQNIPFPSIEELNRLIERDAIIKLRIVLSDILVFQPDNQRGEKNLVFVLNQFKYFVKKVHDLHENTHQFIQKFLVLKDSSQGKVAFHSLFNNKQQNSDLSLLQASIRYYLLYRVSKNLKQFLLLTNKSTQCLLQLYKQQAKIPELKELIELIRDYLNNKQKYTCKIFICYIQILKQKFLQQNEKIQSIEPFCQFSQPFYQFNITHQKPQKDNNAFVSVKQSQQKRKSFYKKIKLNDELEWATQYCRHSNSHKSLSIISMSSTRKNRKYLKYSSKGLFSDTKQSLHRSSSNSFTANKTQTFNRIEKDLSSYNRVREEAKFQTGFNPIKNVNKIQSNQCKKESYLSMMGFGNKNSHQQKISSNNKNLNKENPNQDNLSPQQSKQTAKKTTRNCSPVNLQEKCFTKSKFSNTNELKLRLNQSLSLLEKKNRQVLIPQKQYANQCNNLPDWDCKKLPLESVQGFSSFFQTIRNKNDGFTQMQNRQNIKLKIINQLQMNIKIQSQRKHDMLRLDRSTVFVMNVPHGNQNYKQNNQQVISPSKTISYGNSSKIEYFLEQQNKQSQYLKPSLGKAIKSRQNKEIRKQQTKEIRKQQHKEIRKQQHKEIGNQQKSMRIYSQDSNTRIKNTGKSNLIESTKEKEQNYFPQVIQDRNSKKQKQSIPALNQQKKKLTYISVPQNIQTQYFSKNAFKSQAKEFPKNTIHSSLTLSKNFFKQIFLFINSENKTFVDLLGSKLSYQVTFYAFYLNYYKLNVTKKTTHQTIQKMLFQIKDYESKIKQSRKIQSKQKILPEFQPFVNKLLNLEIEAFLQQYWKKQNLQNTQKKKLINLSEEIDELTLNILKSSLKIILNQLDQFKIKQNCATFLLKGLKISSVIVQLLYCISQKFFSMTVAELKKIMQLSEKNKLGAESKIVEKLNRIQEVIESYNQPFMLSKNEKDANMSLKCQIKKIRATVEIALQKCIKI